MTRTEARAHGSMWLTALLIATSFPVVASIAGAVDSRALVWLRFVLAAAVFVPVLAVRYRGFPAPGLRDLARYAVVSAPLVGFFWAMFEALQTTTPLNTGALFVFGPAFATLSAWLLGGPRPSRRMLGGLAIGSVGALMVVFQGDPHRMASLSLNTGDLLFLAGTLGFGVYAALVRRLHRGEPMAWMTFYTLVTGAGWLTVLCAWAWAAGDLSFEPTEWTAAVALAIVYLAVVTTLITFVLTQEAIRVIGPGRTVAYTYLNPAFVLFWLFVVGAAPSVDGPVGTALGVALTIAAMALLATGTDGAGRRPAK